MPRLSNAFLLINSNLPEYCHRLAELPPCDFWVHEAKLAELLWLPKGPVHDPSEVLTTILACLQQGYGGNNRKKTAVLTGYDAVDLSNENNIMGISYQAWGRVESFSRGDLSKEKSFTRKPRWFKTENRCVIEVKEQMEITLWGYHIKNGGGLNPFQGGV